MAELSAKELKALKKQQKHAQRAARKGAEDAAAGHAMAVAGQAAAGANNSFGAPGSNSSGATFDTVGAKSNTVNVPSSLTAAPTDLLEIRLFDHLEQPRTIAATENVHPAVLHLALKMQQAKIIGSSSRCKAMLQAFVEVIRDYKTPSDSTLSRSLALHLSHQIEALKTGRQLSVSMGNAIRWLKQQTSQLSIDLTDLEAKETLTDQIAAFIRERIDVADRVIVESTQAMIKPGDCLLVFGRSEVVYQTLSSARKAGIEFSVVCVDSSPLFEGKKLSGELIELGIPTTYVLINALAYVIETVSTVLVGAHAMVSNGHLFSRVGTSIVAVMAAERNIPVLVLCETIKFSERVQLDAYAMNELMPSAIAQSEHSNSVFYDLTDQRYISKVITELGALPASSVPVILREYKTHLA